MATGMTPVHLFGVLSQHNRWLSLRQATIAGNIANANTPGYKGFDVEPFEKAMEQAQLAMAKSDPQHMMPAGSSDRAPNLQSGQPWEITESGNGISLENELIKSSDISRAYRLNAGVMKAFHRMILASSKG